MKTIITILLFLISTEVFSQIADITAPIVVLQVADMPTRVGCYTLHEAYYAQDCNGYVEESVNFPDSKSYRFDVSAYSWYTGRRWGKMEIRIDGIAVSKINVNSKTPKMFSAVARIASGSHKVALALTNDGNGIDEKLYLGLLYITPGSSPTPITFPPITRPAPLTTGQLLISDHFASGYLRGFNLGPNQNLTYKDLIAMRSTGANLARYFINLNRIPGTNSYQFAPGALETADRYIALGKKYGFYIIPTLNPLPGGMSQEYWTNAKLQTSIILIWKQLATRYKGNAAVAGYDLINEPRNRHYPEWINFAHQLITAIRSIDPNHVIFVPGSWKSEFFQMAEPLPFYNLVYEAHSYQPQAITHQGTGSSYTKSIPYPSPPGSRIGVWNDSNLFKALNPMRQFVQSYNVPICIGEFSCIRWAPDYSSDKYIASSVKLFEAENWTWTYHGWREYEGWNAEIPSGKFYEYRYVNAKPQIDHFYTLNKYRTDTTAGMKILKKYFALNYTAALPFRTINDVVVYETRAGRY